MAYFSFADIMQFGMFLLTLLMLIITIVQLLIKK